MHPDANLQISKIFDLELVDNGWEGIKADKIGNGRQTINTKQQEFVVWVSGLGFFGHAQQNISNNDDHVAFTFKTF